MASKSRREENGVPARRVGPSVTTLGVCEPNPTRQRRTPMQGQYDPPMVVNSRIEKIFMLFRVLNNKWLWCRL